MRNSTFRILIIRGNVAPTKIPTEFSENILRKRKTVRIYLNNMYLEIR